MAVGLQLEDGLFLVTFVAILVGLGLGFKGLVLGDGGLYSQFNDPSDE